MHSGSVKKGVSVKSNAKNKPDLHLSLAAKILAIIDVSPSYVRLKSGGEKIKFKVKSQKKNLKVMNVEFKPQGRGGGPQWQKDLPLPVKYSFALKDSTNKNGYYEYALSVWYGSPLDQTKHGIMYIYTNHAEKDKIEMRGSIAAKN
jgi:hypothetical protein